MKITKNLWGGLLVLSVVGGASPARADLASDATQTATWFSREVGQLIAFQSASTHFLPGNTVGFPGVEVGIAVGAAFSKLDVNGYRALSFTVLDNQSGQIDLPKTIAVPGSVLHAKVGLPFGLDLGLKGGSTRFDTAEGNSKTEFDNKIVGLELRKKILGGLALPDLSVGLSFDKATGNVTRTERYSGAITGGTMVADMSWRSDWDVKATSLRAVISKKIAIFTPFAGLGVTKLSGDTETRVDISNVNTVVPGVVATNVRGAHKTSESLGHIILGFELTPLPFTRLNLSGLVAKEKFAVSLGLRVQFP